MKKEMKKKFDSAKRRARRTRASIVAKNVRPRLSVFRSSKHISVQLIDDAASKTIVSASDLSVDAKGKKPIEIAVLVGTDLAKKAKAAGIDKVVFDRGSYKFHGRVKALADAAREGGLEF